jgi:hypothetical protein
MVAVRRRRWRTVAVRRRPRSAIHAVVAIAAQRKLGSGTAIVAITVTSI